MNRIAFVILALGIAACDPVPIATSEKSLDADVDSSSPVDAGAPRYYRLDDIVDYADAEAACAARGDSLAVLDTVAKIEAGLAACAVLPHPRPYPAPSCWTATRITSAYGRTATYAIDVPNYIKPADLGSLFSPLCETER